MHLEMQVIEVGPAQAQRDDLGGTAPEMKPHRVEVAVPLPKAQHEATYFGAGERVCRDPLTPARAHGGCRFEAPDFVRAFLPPPQLQRLCLVDQ